MVPIGKLALMRGKLTHTNEILVCLGDNYFAKYSASQAIALCNRRIASKNIIYIFVILYVVALIFYYSFFFYQRQMRC